jgi:hypothetical protein
VLVEEGIAGIEDSMWHSNWRGHHRMARQQYPNGFSLRPC